MIMASDSPAYRAPSRSSPRQNQRLTINPSNPRVETITSSLTFAVNGCSRPPTIRILSLISGEGGSPFMHPSLPAFLTTLTSLTKLHISWYSLNWNVLPADQRQALTHLISLDSLEVLEICAARNFPLDLLRGFSGSELRLTFAGTLIRHVSSQPPATPSPLGSTRLRALRKLALVGQRNIVAFMGTFLNEPDLREALRSLEFLSITCIDGDQFEPERNLELVGHFFRFLDGSRIRELRVQDERPSPVIGRPLGTHGLLCLRDVGSIEAHLSVKHIQSPREVHTAFRDWFTSLLSGLSPSTSNPTSLDITYRVIFSHPPQWMGALVESMGQLWRELDSYLVGTLPSLQQVNLGFQFHGVGGHERWMQFNAENQPAQLNERGADCSFWVRDI